MATKHSASSDEAVLRELVLLGFSDAVVETPRRAIISLEGPEKSGKTHFALTGPEPVIYYDIDIGTEGVLGKFQKEGKRVFVSTVRVPKEGQKASWEAQWANFKLKVRKTYQISAGTVVWDTATEAYELCRLAHFGRLTEVKPSDYAIVNNEWREVLRLAYDSRANSIFIHKTKAIWKAVANSRGGSSLTKTDDQELSGFSEMGYLVQASLVSGVKKGETGGQQFTMYIRDCRQNPDLAGTLLEWPMVNFDTLLDLIHGEE